MSILRQKSVFYWLSSTNITVDEVMIKYEGRTSQKVTIPNKSISTDSKIFALADFGYIFNWECTKPGLNEGLLTVKKCVSVSIPNSLKITLLTPTQSVFVRLTSCLSMFIEQKKLNFHMFLDNLFTSWKSVQTLKERGITVTETVRKSVADYSPRLLMFKIANRTLEWDHLEAIIIHEIAYWL